MTMTTTPIAYLWNPPDASVVTRDAQRQAIARWQESTGVDDVVEIADQCGSALRPALLQALNQLRTEEPGTASKATAVVVAEPRVLGASNAEQILRCLQVKDAGGALIFLDDEDGDPLNRLLQEAAGGDRGAAGERVRSAMRRKAVKGEVLGRPPYGYTAGRRHRLEVVPEEAAIVRYLFRLYVHEGLGIRLIARRLNDEGYFTRRGGSWSMVTIRDILRNRVYLGTYSRFGVRVAGSHPALISAEEFRRAQDRMAARRTSGGPRNVSLFVLSGLAHCGACGNRMIGVSRRQSWQRRGDGGTSSAEYRYYQCGSRTNQSRCSYHTHRSEGLEELVRKEILAAASTPVEQAEAETAAMPSSRPTVEDLLGETLTVLSKLVDRVAGGQAPRDRLLTAGVELAARHERLSRRLLAAQAAALPTDAAAIRAHQLTRLSDAWDEMTLAERQDLIRDLVNRVTVFDDRVEVELSG